MPPHNLREVCAAVNRFLDEPNVSVEELLQIMKGPDFPTGGILMGVEGVKNYYATGQGRVVVRGVAEIEESDGGNRGDRIIVTELPYQVNKAQWITTIAEMVKDKKTRRHQRYPRRVGQGRDPGRLRAEKGHDLCGHPQQPVQIHGAGVQFLGLEPRDRGRPPKILNLPALLGNFVHHRIEVIRRRSEFDLNKCQERVHILNGLLTALAKHR